MYRVAAFREDRTEVMRQLMRSHPLATLVTAIGGQPEANHLPLLFDDDPAPQGRLIGHVARANPLWRNAGEGIDALAIFHGPQAYITPSWYATKRETGAVVPTWNYAVVHVRGRLVVHDDRDWVHQLVTRLTDAQEAPRPAPWAVGDAPPDYLERMLQAIVGIELRVESVEGKWKVSQNRPQADRAGVAAGLSAAGDDASQAMAALVAAAKPLV
ncbi:MAG: FMN-binding negative transcriptional regulator [Betaproteobacteria bacterium]|nr:FMN-binding negative transcriptional regulator [Betaproteobacteria bacterium]